MKKLTKKEFRECINNIFEFIDSGKIIMDDDTFFGHPGLYFFHSREEFEEKLEQLIEEEYYDEYDLYYIVNKLIKYMLGRYDSHTQIKFINNRYLPIEFMIENDMVYITNISPDLENILGGEIISVNSISIKAILKELEEIISYSTIQFLHTNQERGLCNFDILRSLPSIPSDTNVINFKVLYKNQIKDINFDINDLPKECIYSVCENYSTRIIDDCIVVCYNSCRDKEKMKTLINKLESLSKEKQINNYIIDLRNNGGGDSSIIKPLIEYLRNKNVVVLINERVFSSGRMSLIELKKIGAYSIGTDISTSLNCFGNVPGELTLENMNLMVKRSSTYWLYDENFTCTGYTKDEFSDYFKTRKELSEPIILHPDEYVYLSVNDVINNNDLQLKRALEYFNQSKIR